MNAEQLTKKVTISSYFTQNKMNLNLSTTSAETSTTKVLLLDTPSHKIENNLNSIQIEKQNNEMDFLKEFIFDSFNNYFEFESSSTKEQSIKDITDFVIFNNNEIYSLFSKNEIEFICEIVVKNIYDTCFSFLEDDTESDEDWDTDTDTADTDADADTDTNTNTEPNKQDNSLDESHIIIIPKEEIEQKIKTLSSIYQPAQRTKEWYEYRNNCLTASNIWKIFGSESNKNSIIYEKCKEQTLHISSSFSVNSLQWGIKYEKVSQKIYETKNNTKVGEFGCIRHPQYPFIGASPDGINIDKKSPIYGRMLEIKNIVNREITNTPKIEYWIQMQIQMETCDLDECDFVETRIKEYTGDYAESLFNMDNLHEYKGVILLFLDRETSSTFYEYSELFSQDIFLDLEMIQEWIEQTKEKNKEKYSFYEKKYWYLDQFSCILCKRDKEWFQNSLPQIENIWNIIEKERIEGFEHREPKKKEKKQNKCLFSLDEIKLFE